MAGNELPKCPIELDMQRPHAATRTDTHADQNRERTRTEPTSANQKKPASHLRPASPTNCQ